MRYDPKHDAFYAMHGCSACATPIGTHGDLMRHMSLLHGKERTYGDDVCQCNLLRALQPR